MQTRRSRLAGTGVIGVFLLGIALSGAIGRTGALRAQMGGAGSNLYAVDCSGTSFCVAVGAGGTIRQYNGSGWSSQTSGTSNDLYDVACPSTTFCVAIGAAGIILQYNGSAWSPQASGTVNNLYGVTCPSTSACLAVGASGAFSRYNGSSWSTPPPSPLQTPGTTGDLYDIACPSASLCFAAGAGGRVFRYDSVSWFEQPSGTSNALTGISCPSTNLCFAVGAGGTIVQFNATSSGTVPSGTHNDLISVACPNIDTCFAVGSNAAVLAFNSRTWGLSGSSESSSNLSDVACPNTSFCVAVGANDTILQGLAWNLVSGPTGTPGAPGHCPPSPPAPVPSPSPTPEPPPPGAFVDVCYPPGWNLVGGPAGFPVPLWIWDPVAAQYHEHAPGPQAGFAGGPSGETNGHGAWAYFSQTTSVTFFFAVPFADPVSVSLTAGQWQQIGDPFPADNALACGSATVFVYDSTTGAYIQNNVLGLGQGAWAFSPAGGSITLVLPAQGCPPA